MTTSASEGGQMAIKLMKHYVTDGVSKARVHYCFGPIKGVECVTLYAKDYSHDLEKIFPDAINNSDGMTDFYEKSRVRIYADNELWAAALARSIR